MQPSPATDVEVVLLGSRALSPSVLGLRLGPAHPSAATPSWRAGQYFELFTGATPTRRVPYSIASHLQTERPGEFELAVSLAGARELLREIDAGARLFVSAAQGRFVWQNISRATLLVGIGTGLAPLRAMQQAALAQDTEHRMTLLFGARTEADLLWGEEFARIARARPNFVFEPTLSLPSASWSGRRGRVQEHLTSLAQPLLPDLAVYLCGTPAMVDDCTARLLALGVPQTRIFSEAY